MRWALLTAALLVACGPHAERLSFQVRASDLRHAPQGHQEFVEITAPGMLLNPPVEVKTIARNQAGWSTPESAVASIVSANIAGNISWAIENYTPEERAQAERSLHDPEVAQRTWNFYRNMGRVMMMGWAEVRGYRLVLLQGRDPDGDTTFTVETLKKSADGWRETNALADSSEFEIIWTALHTGGIRAM